MDLNVLWWGTSTYQNLKGWLSQKGKLKSFVFQKVRIWQPFLDNQLGGCEYNFRCLKWFFIQLPRMLRSAFLSKTKIFENMAFDHVNEVPTWKLDFVSNISSMVVAAKISSIYRTAFSVKQKYSVTKITQPCNDDVITIHWWWCHHQISLNWIGGTSEPSQAAPMALNRYYSHLNKSRILKNLNLRKKADCNFRGNLQKKYFRHLKLY